MSDVRADGREDHQLRPFAAEQGLLNKADGSARLSVGDTQVLVGVWGPMPPKTARLDDPDRATVQTVVKPQSGSVGPREKAWEALLRDVVEAVVLLEEHPRTSIQVVVQILGEDGSILPAVIHTVALALMDAVLPMRYTPVAATVGYPEEGTRTVMDLLDAEEKTARTTGFFCFTSVDGEAVVASDVHGRFQPAELSEMRRLARLVANSAQAFLEIAQRKKIAQQLRTDDNVDDA